MDIVHSWKDVLEAVGKSHIVIWGMGRIGSELLCELEVSGFTDYHVCDSNVRLGELTECFLSLPELHQLTARCPVSIVIAVKGDEAVKEIADQISAFCDREQVTFFQYIPESREELIERRKKKGFFNGLIYKKTLETDKAVNTLKGMIRGERPFLFARWGEIEGEVVYKMKAGGMKSLSDEERLLLERNAGVFPISENVLKMYCKVMENAASEIDILCAFYWQRHLEKWIEWYSPDAMVVSSDLEYPFFTNPWTAALEGMKVLVVHPFAKLIEKQYGNRDKLFRNGEVLPGFELMTYQAVQSMGGSDEYKDWLEALDKMKDDLGKMDFDIALIGCGAYGMPLGAYVKSELHKKAIHMGGSLQILFGIKGKRWEGNNYDYQHKLYNEYWIRPTDDLKPRDYKDVEDGCYW